MNNYMEDHNDEGLKAVMGSRFHDATKEGNVTASPAKTAHIHTSKPMDAKWEPVRKYNWMDNLKAIAVYASIFGGLNLLIFCWMQKGLMDDSIAIPCMWGCVAMVGFFIGKFSGRGK